MAAKSKLSYSANQNTQQSYIFQVNTYRLHITISNHLKPYMFFSLSAVIRLQCDLGICHVREFMKADYNTRWLLLTTSSKLIDVIFKAFEFTSVYIMHHI